MVLPPAGTYISLSNIQVEFGGDNPVLLSEYYSSGTYTQGIAGIPSTGPINLSDFAGKSKPAVVPTGTNLVLNPNFTSTTSWTSASGWGATDTNSQLYNSSRPSIKLSDPASTYTTYLMFSYPSSGQLVFQTISLTTPKSSYTFSYYLYTVINGQNTPTKQDKYFARAVFKNGATTIHTIGVTALADINWTTWQQQTYTTSINVSSATSVVIELSGYDAGFWNGNHGPRFANISLV